MLSQLRLNQLLSPVLPVGAYSYSQGLEWAVQAKWIDNGDSFNLWLDELIQGPLAQQELPLLKNLYQAFIDENLPSINYWSQMTVACRDTAELRAEEHARAAAYLRVVNNLPYTIEPQYRSSMENTSLTTIAWACVQWGIDLPSLLNAFAYNWLDAYIVNGVKLIPLGQSEGQALLHAKLPLLTQAVETSLRLSDDAIGFSVPLISMASCRHETQYSRIYRS